MPAAAAGRIQGMHVSSEHLKLSLAIEGMNCSACAARLQRALDGADGVSDAAVSFALERAVVRVDPSETDAAGVLAEIKRSGFEAGTETASFRVENLSDGKSARAVEAAVREVPGVLEVAANPATGMMRVTGLSLMLDDEAVFRSVGAVGFQCVPEGDSGAQSRREIKRARHERRAIAVAAALTLPFLVQMAGMAASGGSVPSIHMPPWAELLLALPIQFGFGLRFYRGALSSLRGRSANMDVLVALGTTSAFAYSCYLLYELGPAAQGNLYFEASAVIITLVMVGKHLEANAKRSAAAAVRDLLALRPDTAIVRLPDGGTESRRASALNPGDTVVCRPGDRLAVDGIIVKGEADIDESLITGESAPVPKGEGDSVSAGSINVDGFIDIETAAVGENSTLSRMIRLVENAQVSKPAVHRLVDRVSAVFVPAIILIAVATFIGWTAYGAGLEQAFKSAASTLVIACPCALGLATPTAIMAGSGAATKAGILIRDAAALEQAHRLSLVAFDKTGTLTEGKPAIADMQLLSDLAEDEVLTIAASLQQGSEHPVAQAFIDEASGRGLGIRAVENFRSHVSRGIEGVIDGRRYMLGGERMYRSEGGGFTPPGRMPGGTPVWLAETDSGAKRPLAAFVLVDRLRPTSRAAIDQLKDLGIRTILLSGDAARIAEGIGAELGIEETRGAVLPEEKAEIVASLGKDGAIVGMVGDGINDSPALASASVGFAMGTGTGIAMETSSITLMRPDPRLVPATVSVSRRTFRKIKQNLFWAFVFNTTGVPLAALGFLNPSIAGAAMAFSSLCVVANSLLLRTWRPRSD